MRDIKFRAWVSLAEMVYCTGDWSITFDGSRDALITMWCSDGPVDEFTSGDVMQFTGLQDKNNVDIYEGDVIKDDEGLNHEVTFNEFGIDLSGCYDSGDYYMGKIPDTFPWDKFEVIGNIHENPELLEK